MNSHTVKFGVISCVISSALILGGCVSTYKEESTGQYFDSSTITMKVKANLLADKQVKSLPITVNTYKNVVQLSGFVDNQIQKDRAEEIARNVKGVRGVNDSLIIKHR